MSTNYSKNSTTFKTLSEIGRLLESFNVSGTKAGEVFESLTEAQQKLVLSGDLLTKQQKQIIVDNTKLSMSEVGVITTTEGVVLSEEKATTSTFSLSSAFKGLAASLGITTTVLGVITGALAVVSVGIIAYKKWADYQEELRQSAIDASKALKEQSKSVDDYVERYQELQIALRNAKGDEESTYAIKQDLLTLQKELNDAFGEEYGKLNLVTDAYKDQTDAIKQYNKEFAQSYLNEHEIAIKTAKSKMESNNHYNLTGIGEILNSDRGSILKEIAESYEDRGVSILDETGDGSYSLFSIHLNANAEDAQDVINDFMNDVREKATELNDEDLFADVLEISSNSLNKSKGIIEEYGEQYKSGLLSEIATNDGLSTGFNQIIQAVERYNEAILKSEDPYNDENVKNAWNNLQTVKQGIEENVDVWGKYKSVTTEAFEQANDSAYSFYQALQNDDSISKLADDLKGLSETDLQSMANDGTQDSFDKLCQSASDYGLEIQDVIDLLIKLGVVQGKISGDFLNPDEITVSFDDIFSLKDADNNLTNLGKISESIDTIQNAYKTLDDAIDEYNENGSISIDTLQSVIGLGDNWLDYLVDEKGNLTLSSEKLQELTRSRLDDMRVQALNNMIDNVSKIEDDADAALYLASTNYAAADSYEMLAWQSANATQELLKARVKKGDLSQENYDDIVAKMNTDINKVNQLFTNTDFTSDFGFGSSSSSSADTQKELVDFFDRRIKVLDDANELLESNLENVVGSYAKNTLIDSQLDIAEERFRNYTEALDMYSELANTALSKLPTDLAEKVKNGSLSISNENSDVADAINDYEEWADKVTECEQELAALKETIRQLELDKFNNIIEDFTSQFDIHESANELIDKQISLFEEAGELIGESFYTTQLEESQKQLNLLEKEKTALVNQLNSALSSGRIQAGTDEWLEMVNALSDVDGSILDCKTSMEELDNAILDLHTEIFERVQNQFSNLNSELENLYGLFDEDAAVTDGNQNWTNAALAQLGLLAQQYELSQYQIQQYDKEIEQLNADYLNGKYSAIEYTDKLADLSSAQWDAVNSSESIKDSIIDLNQTRIDEIVEGIEEEISAYQELTNAQIDTLKAEKELHDYEESIAEKTNSVTKLERQIAAMKNDTTAATVAKRLQLEEELAQAKKELEDAEYEHFIASQEEALNQQYEDYETARNDEITALQESLLNKEDILAQSFETVKQNSTIVGEQITMIAQQHGVRISNALISAWTNGENAIASYGTTLSAHSSAFILSIMGVETEIWNLQNHANHTAGTLANMFSSRADNLVQQLTDSWTSADTLNTMTGILEQSLVDTLQGDYDVSSIVSSLNSIADSANAAADAFRRMYEEQYGSSGKWYIIDQKTNQILSRGFQNQSEALSWVPTYTKANRGGTVTVRQFAKGTRNANAGLRVINEQGYELVLPKLSSGNYALGNAGDQILTKEQTDNLFDWAQINPDVYSLQNLITPLLPPLKAESSPVTINYDSLVRVDGDVNNSNIKQIQAVVQDGLKQFAIQVNRDYRYGRK